MFCFLFCLNSGFNQCQSCELPIVPEPELILCGFAAQVPVNLREPVLFLEGLRSHSRSISTQERPCLTTRPLTSHSYRSDTIPEPSCYASGASQHSEPQGTGFGFWLFWGQCLAFCLHLSPHWSYWSCCDSFYYEILRTRWR